MYQSFSQNSTPLQRCTQVEDTTPITPKQTRLVSTTWNKDFRILKIKGTFAHETFFEKLMAEYFINKKGQVAKNREVIEGLNSEFDIHKVSEDHPRSGLDKNFR